MKMKVFLYIGVIFLLSGILASAALDLQFVSAIAQLPNPANAGDTVQFSVSFKTTGGPVTNLKIIGGVDGSQLFERTYASILADKTKTDFFTWTAIGGSHTAWFKLDPGHTTGDINFSNNTIEKQITVGSGTPGQKPNLTVSAVYSPLSVTNGANITFTATVTNNGNAPAASSKLDFRVFGGLEGEYDVPALTVGQKANVTINWLANCNSPCNAYIAMNADSMKIIDESDEGDNQWLKLYICDCASNYKPNMKVSATYSPLKPKNGDKVTFNITVKNDGDKESKRVYLGFYLAGTLINSFTVEPMAKKTQKTITYDWIANCGQQCLAKIDLFIDNQYEADESNESDNHWIKDIACECINIIQFQKKPIIIH
jgi:subtilase family serine protease